MTSDPPAERATPSFAASMNPVRYQRLGERPPHQMIEPATPQLDLFVLAYMGIPGPMLPLGGSRSRVSSSGARC
jgi:hypothetical protein